MCHCCSTVRAWGANTLPAATAIMSENNLQKPQCSRAHQATLTPPTKDQTESTKTLFVNPVGSGPISRGPPILFVAVVAEEILEGPRSSCLPVAGKTLGQAGFEAMHAVSHGFSGPRAGKAVLPASI